jgi:glucose-6-phosphate 1-epimerase
MIPILYWPQLMSIPTETYSSMSASGSHEKFQFHGQEALRMVSGDGAQATVLFHGGQLISWRSARGQERLYLSERAIYDGIQAVRGGVPVVFPQFANSGPLVKHGFARRQTWQLVHVETTAHDAMAVFGLHSNATTLTEWPFEFELELTLRVTNTCLDMELSVLNSGSEPLSFTTALHTYLRLPDVRPMQLHGLKRLRYRDAVNDTEQVDHDPFVQAVGELDRVYFDAASPLSLNLGEQDAIPWRISQTGFSDVVVWNPGPVKAAQLLDMPDEDWVQMLCVEASQVGAPIVLQAREQWVGRQTVDCEPMGAPE